MSAHRNAAGNEGNAPIAQKRIGRDDLLVVRGRAAARSYRRKNIMKTNRTIAGWLLLLAFSTLNLQPSTAFAQGWRSLAG